MHLVSELHDLEAGAEWYEMALASPPRPGWMEHQPENPDDQGNCDCEDGNLWVESEEMYGGGYEIPCPCPCHRSDD